MVSDELTENQKTVIDWVTKQHDEHPERDVFQVMGRIWLAASQIDDSFAELEVIEAYRKLTVEQRNRAGSYAALPF